MFIKQNTTADFMDNYIKIVIKRIIPIRVAMRYVKL